MNCYETGVFDENPDPTIIDTKNMTRMHPEDCDLQLKLEVQDTAGEPAHELQRLSWYAGADVFMLCFSKDQQDDGDDCVQRWITEIRNNEPRKPIVVILTKKDLGDENFTL